MRRNTFCGVNDSITAAKQGPMVIYRASFSLFRALDLTDRSLDFISFDTALNSFDRCFSLRLSRFTSNDSMIQDKASRSKEKLREMCKSHTATVPLYITRYKMKWNLIMFSM